MKGNHIQPKGLSSVELIIGVSIAGLVLTYCIYAIGAFMNSSRDLTLKTEALYLAEEGLEQVRFLRDNNWTNISSLPLNTTRYLAVSSTTVSVTTTPQTVNGFTKSFTVQNVYRNSSTDDIVASTTGGSVADSDAKYIFMTVSWGTPTSTVSLVSILANLNP